MGSVTQSPRNVVEVEEIWMSIWPIQSLAVFIRWKSQCFTIPKQVRKKFTEYEGRERQGKKSERRIWNWVHVTSGTSSEYARPQ